MSEGKTDRMQTHLDWFTQEFVIIYLLHVVPNLYGFLLWNKKIYILNNISVFCVNTM